VKKKILVFIPCFNVSKYVFSTFQKIPFKEINKLAKVSYLFIEDCSNDQTYLVIKKLKNNYLFRNMNNKISIIKNKINLGYGGVQKLAYNYCKKKNIDFCIMLHGDGQYNPMYLPKFIKLLLKYCNIINNKNLATNEVRVLGVFGSRMIDKKRALQGGMPIYKWIGNQVLTKVQNALTNQTFSEWHTGYRAYRVSRLRQIPLNKLDNGFRFDTQIILELLASEQRITEIPIPTYYGDEISHVNGLEYAREIIWDTIRHRVKHGVSKESSIDK
jgi:hypothetical protein